MIINADHFNSWPLHLQHIIPFATGTPAPVVSFESSFTKPLVSNSCSDSNSNSNEGGTRQKYGRMEAAAESFTPMQMSNNNVLSSIDHGGNFIQSNQTVNTNVMTATPIAVLQPPLASMVQHCSTNNGDASSHSASKNAELPMGRKIQELPPSSKSSSNKQFFSGSMLPLRDVAVLLLHYPLSSFELNPWDQSKLVSVKAESAVSLPLFVRYSIELGIS